MCRKKLGFGIIEGKQRAELKFPVGLKLWLIMLSGALPNCTAKCMIKLVNWWTNVGYSESPECFSSLKSEEPRWFWAKRINWWHHHCPGGCPLVGSFHIPSRSRNEGQLFSLTPQQLLGLEHGLANLLPSIPTIWATMVLAQGDGQY